MDMYGYHAMDLLIIGLHKIFWEVNIQKIKCLSTELQSILISVFQKDIE